MSWVRGVVEHRGEASCILCHGDNGTGSSTQEE
jgi:cytochrome c